MGKERTSEREEDESGKWREKTDRVKLKQRKMAQQGWNQQKKNANVR